MSNTDLTKLVIRAQKDKARHFDELYKAIWPTLYKFALMRLGPRADADAQNIAQEASFKIYTNLEKLKEPCAFKGWMNKILSNQIYEHYRRTQNERTELGIGDNIDLDSFDPVTTSNEEAEKARALTQPELAALRKDSTHMMQTLIGTLSPKQSEAMLLHYYSELTVEEIAGILEIPYGTVLTRLHSGRKNLRETLIEVKPNLANELESFFSAPLLGSLIKSAVNTLPAPPTPPLPAWGSAPTPAPSTHNNPAAKKAAKAAEKAAGKSLTPGQWTALGLATATVAATGAYIFLRPSTPKPQDSPAASTSETRSAESTPTPNSAEPNTSKEETSPTDNPTPPDDTANAANSDAPSSVRSGGRNLTSADDKPAQAAKTPSATPTAKKPATTATPKTPAKAASVTNPSPAQSPAPAPTIARGDRLRYGSQSGAALTWRVIAVSGTSAYCLPEQTLGSSTHPNLNTTFQTLRSGITFSPTSALLSIKIPTTADLNRISATSSTIKTSTDWWLANAASEGMAALVDTNGSITYRDANTTATVRPLLEIDRNKTEYNSNIGMFGVTL